MRNFLRHCGQYLKEGGLISYLFYLFEDKPHIPHGKTIWYILFSFDLWLSLLIAFLIFLRLESDISFVGKMRAHFGDLLKATSIVFGFCIATLTFYMQTAATWKREPRIDQIGKLAVELHVWLTTTWLGILVFIIVLWIWGTPKYVSGKWLSVSYSFLVFLFSYGCLQILAQILELAVFFHNRDMFQEPASTRIDKSQENQVSSSSDSKKSCKGN